MCYSHWAEEWILAGKTLILGKNKLFAFVILEQEETLGLK